MIKTEMLVPGARLISCRTIGFRSADYHHLTFAGGDSTKTVSLLSPGQDVTPMIYPRAPFAPFLWPEISVTRI
jgi:hypothetical protein